MIAPAKPSPRSRRVPVWHHQFLAMVPKIVAYARWAFRHLQVLTSREEAVHEVIANALVAYVRLVEQGRAELAYPTVLARYGVVAGEGRPAGRPVAGMRVRCYLRFAQRRKRLRRRASRAISTATRAQWREAVIEDDSTPVPDQAAFRIDFPAWLGTQAARDRRVAEALAVGQTTGEVSRSSSEITPRAGEPAPQAAVRLVEPVSRRAGSGRFAAGWGRLAISTPNVFCGGSHPPSPRSPRSRGGGRVDQNSGAGRHRDL